jgi:distribution and morphology protein 10
LQDIASSKDVSLQNVVAGYRILQPLRRPENAMYWERWLNGVRIDTRETLLYGRFFLPGNSLEAMAIRRLSPKSQFLMTCVSDPSLKNNGAVTVTYQRDSGRFGQEFVYSTYETLLGYRALYNLGFDQRVNNPAIASRLAVGLELFYGVSNKSPGFSTALRYTTQSAYTGTPLTLTLMSNPLMGHISASYAVRTTTASSFASRFDFNVYSYVSDLSIGCEIWRRRPISTTVEAAEDEFSSVFKASTSLSQQTVRLLWEGKAKEFLVSSGLGLSFADRSPAATSFGIELQYSS